MPQKIGGGCFSQEYGSSTHDDVKIGVVVAKKLALLFHIPSRIHTVVLNKKLFSHGKILGSDKPDKS